MKQISIKEGAVMYAARFISEYNKFLSDMSFRELEADIQSYVDRVRRDAMQNWEMQYISTGGWTVTFYPEDDNYGMIEILVDPSVSKNLNFVYVWGESFE